MVFLLEMVRAPITNWEITHTLCPRYGGSRGGENQGPSPHHTPPPPRRGARCRLHTARLGKLFRNPDGALHPLASAGLLNQNLSAVVLAHFLI